MRPTRAVNSGVWTLKRLYKNSILVDGGQHASGRKSDGRDGQVEGRRMLLFHVVAYAIQLYGDVTNSNFSRFSHMMFSRDVLTWCSHVTFSCDVLAWRSRVTFSRDVLAWRSRVTFSRDVLAWRSHVTFSRDVLAWRSRVTFSRDVLTWRSHMMFSRDLLTWCSHILYATPLFNLPVVVHANFLSALWPWRLTFKRQGGQTYLWSFLSLVVCIIQTWSWCQS